MECFQGQIRRAHLCPYKTSLASIFWFINEKTQRPTPSSCLYKSQDIYAINFFYTYTKMYYYMILIFKGDLKKRHI